MAGELDVEGDGQHLADALHQVPVLIQYVALLHSAQGLNTNTWIASGRRRRESGGRGRRVWKAKRRRRMEEYTEEEEQF